MATSTEVVAGTEMVLRADGILDNLVGAVKAPFSDAEVVEKSVAVTGMILTSILGFAGGIAFESRGNTVPFLSDFVRPKGI